MSKSNLQTKTGFVATNPLIEKFKNIKKMIRL